MVETFAAVRRIRSIALVGLFALAAACGEEDDPADQADNQPPSLSGTPPTSVVADDTYSFTPTAEDPDGDPLVFGVDGLPEWAEFDSVTGTLTGTPAEEDVGTYRGIVVWVTDGDEDTLLPAFDIVVEPAAPTENSAPEISGTPSESAMVGEPYEFVPQAEDADGDELAFAVRNLPDWAAFDEATGAVSGTPGSDSAGTYRDIVISVSDGEATTTLPPFSITVREAGENAPPTISGEPMTSVAAGVAYSFTPTADDADGDPLTFAVENAPAWASFDTSTGELAGTPTDGDVGDYEDIVISVTDGEDSASLAAFTLTVTEATTNTPPTISGAPAATVEEGQEYSFRPTASDADGDELEFSIANKPGWARFNSTSGRLRGTPTADDVGTYENIRISVSDGEASATLPAFSITVTAAPPAPNSEPTISGNPATSVVAGEAYTFTPSASDPDGDELEFSIENKPSWASFNAATGKLAGTPTDGDVGTYSDVQISVSDGDATASLPSFSIEVTASEPAPSNSPPTISGNPSKSVLQGQAYSFRPTASDPDDDELTFSIENKPAWASFNESTGRLSGTPSAGDVGTFSDIRISVSDGQESASLPAFSITVEAVALGTATLSWTAPDQREDGSALTNLAGFKVYWGTEEGSYPNEATLSNPGVTTYVVENLTSGTWYFVVTALDSDGLESDFSNVASKTIP